MPEGEAQELIEQLNSHAAFKQHEVVKGGNNNGTWGDEIVAVDYAGWTSGLKGGISTLGLRRTLARVGHSVYPFLGENPQG